MRWERRVIHTAWEGMRLRERADGALAGVLWYADPGWWRIIVHTSPNEQGCACYGDIWVFSEELVATGPYPLEPLRRRLYVLAQELTRASEFEWRVVAKNATTGGGEGR